MVYASLSVAMPQEMLEVGPSIKATKTLGAVWGRQGGQRISTEKLTQLSVRLGGNIVPTYI